MANKIYKDLEGNEIGTLEYLQGSYLNLMFHISLCLADFYNDKSFDIGIINDKLNTYLAVRYCYDENTSSGDCCINKIMSNASDFAKHINYKPII